MYSSSGIKLTGTYNEPVSMNKLTTENIIKLSLNEVPNPYLKYPCS